MNHEPTIPNAEPAAIDFATVREALMSRGITIGGWAVVNGYHTTTVLRAIRGVHDGLVSREIMRKLVLFIADTPKLK